MSIAEKLLESIEVQRNYAVLLLNLVDKQEVDMTIRIAGAIAFKNYVKRNWVAHEVCTATQNTLRLLSYK